MVATMTQPQHIFTVRMPPEIRTWLEEFATAHRISINAALIMLVQEARYAREPKNHVVAVPVPRSQDST
jgi:hypothetical protein